MSLSRTHWGDQVTEYGTSQLYPMGTLRESVDGTYGLQVYRYVQIDAGVTLKVGYGVMKKAGTAAGLGILSGAATPVARMLGAAQVVIPASNYGWVLASGMGVLASVAGGFNTDVVLKGAANGQFDNGVVADADGWAFSHAAAAAVADTTAVCTIRCI